MTIVARRFSSVPERSASDTWKAIVELVAPDPTSTARTELTAIANPVCAMIASEIDAPIVFRGNGPWLRVYCLYGEEAIIGEKARETPLSFVPTEGTWSMSLPCPSEDLEWVQRRLAGAPHVSARDEEDTAVARPPADPDTKERSLPVNREAFLRS